MKRIFSCILVSVLLFSMIPIRGNAAENQMETIYFEDGSYMTVEVITMGTRASGLISGTKPYTYYDSDGSAQWKAILSGFFTYNGSSATCTSASVDVTIYNSAWYVSSKSAGKSGNTASASVTMGKKMAGVTVMTKTVNLSLSCDKNGNLS